MDPINAFPDFLTREDLYQGDLCPVCLDRPRPYAKRTCGDCEVLRSLRHSGTRRRKLACSILAFWAYTLFTVATGLGAGYLLWGAGR